MSSGISNFVDLLLKGDFFLIFLLVVVIIIISSIIYLIKLQINDKMYYEDDDFDFEIEDDKEVTNSIKEEVKDKEEKVIKQEKFDFDKIEPKKDYIQSYEDEQEELAIISASELEKRLQDMKNNNTYDSHEKEIEEYEQEQENKAIISYEELLKRASANTISYESEEDLGGIKIGKVDTKSIETYSETNDKPYYKEETFLQSLKEFRRAL